MLLSILLGLFRFPLWTPIIIAIGGTIIDYYMYQGGAEFRRQVGRAEAGADVFFLGFLFSLGFNYVAYGIGRGGRWLWDRMRQPTPG